MINSYKELKIKSAWDEGFNVATAGSKDFDNLHPPETEEWNAWIEGYEAGYKKVNRSKGLEK